MFNGLEPSDCVTVTGNKAVPESRFSRNMWSVLGPCGLKAAHTMSSRNEAKQQ